jgi:(E)-4-hydroxy-3-methylbut-2-enyl-diphosphate synthase
VRSRRKTKQIRVGGVTIGGGAPIRVQSMTKTDTRDAAATIAQIKMLADCGCEIIRCAVPDQEAAASLASIKKNSPIPVIADIHFDYRLALAALQSGVDGLRLNPGNIRDPEQVASVVKAAKERQAPIRVGINSGSLSQEADPDLPLTERMVNSALDYVKRIEDLGFDLIKISLKSYDVPSTVSAYELISRKTKYPLHIGITEAGLPRAGTIRSSVGIGVMLAEGIGDTLRVSLSGQPQEEVEVGYEILKSLNIREHGPCLVSCPTCGRTEVDIIGLPPQSIRDCHPSSSR